MIQKQIKFPSVSIIIITKNVERTIANVLRSIAKQDFPKKKLDILVVDGQSTDNTLKIIKDYKKKYRLDLKVIQSEYPNDPEACRGVGVRQVKGEVIGFVDSDNYMPHKNWLKKMLTPLVHHAEIYGTQSLRYGYRRTDSSLNRYFALLGSCDPVGFYLKKADRLSYLYDDWNLYGKILKKYNNYFLVKFDPDFFPTLGCNGFFFRKHMLFKTKVSPQNFFHIDTPLDLARKQIDTYAIVEDEILHDTAGSFLTFLQKRARYMKLHYQMRSGKRRYKVFDPSRKRDIFNLAKFIVYSITFIQPFFFAVRGFLKKPDFIWFIHPIFCFPIMVTYSFMVVIGLVRQNILFSAPRMIYRQVKG